MDATIKYPRTPHIEGSAEQVGDEKAKLSLKALAGAFCVLEEKIDGANSSIRFENGRMILQSRGHVLSGGPREEQFAPFKAWCARQEEELYSLLGEKHCMYGEWAYALHSSAYDHLSHHFHEFDILDRETGQFLNTAQRWMLLANASFPSVPVVHFGPLPQKKEALLALIKNSSHKTENWRERVPSDLLAQIDNTRLMEGLYGKVENETAAIGRFKFVRAGFAQTILEADHWMKRDIFPNELSEIGKEFFFSPKGAHPERQTSLIADLQAAHALMKPAFNDSAQFEALCAKHEGKKTGKKIAGALR